MDHRKKALTPGRRTEGEFVLYWMQASVRIRDNWALAEASRQAQTLGLPLAIAFCLVTDYPEANARSLAFLLDGLADVARQLAGVGHRLTVALGSPEVLVPRFAAGAALLVTDKGYLPVQRRWRQQVALAVTCPVIEVEDNLCVPVETASTKDEWAAATLRPKLLRLVELEPLPLVPELRPNPAGGLDLEARWRAECLPLAEGLGRGLLQELPVDHSVPPTAVTGGETQGISAWNFFLQNKLATYDTDRNDPNLEGTTGLAPYLHFGQVSPLTLVRDLKSGGRWDAAAKFVDELVVRRELSHNFVWYNPQFDSFSGLPDWARKTLANHALDRRDYLYTDDQWEAAATHDDAWNAAQTQLVTTGTLHGYLRMYWGKKLLEWSADPAQALKLALWLNNKYALDGRDANSYAGVAWCFGKHDRPWGERPVYGLVRCMTSGGLKRKFDLGAYVRRFIPPSSAPPRPRELPF